MSGRTLPFSTAATGLSAAQPKRAGWLAWMTRCLQAIETRRHLAEMDDRMLKDIGITRLDALHEAGRSPWDHDGRPGRDGSAR